MKIYIHESTNSKKLVLGSLISVNEIKDYIQTDYGLETFNNNMTPELYDALEKAINDPRGALDVPVNYPIRNFRIGGLYNKSSLIEVGPIPKYHDKYIPIYYIIHCDITGIYEVSAEKTRCEVSDYLISYKKIDIHLNFDGTYSFKIRYSGDPIDQLHKLDSSSNGIVIFEKDGMYPHYTVEGWEGWTGYGICKQKYQIDEVIDEIYNGKFKQRRRRIIYDLKYNK